MKIFQNSRYIGLFLFIVSIILYFSTANRFVTFTDNGELAASSILLGISHPSGYPLFTILGYLWSLLPLPISKILQMNLLSAIYVALSALILYTSIIYLLKNYSYKIKTKISNKTSKGSISHTWVQLPLEDIDANLIAFITALTYTTATTIWQQANFYEVYSLQLLLFSLFLFYLLKIYFSPNNEKYWYAIAFVWGLMLTNHLIAVWLAPALFWLYFLDEERKFKFDIGRIKKLLLPALFVLIPLSIYLYLPIRSAMLPEINWGWVHRSLDKFLYHLSGKQYQIWMFSDNSVAIKNLGSFVSLLPYQLGFLGLIFMLIGFFKLLKNKQLFIVFSLILIFTIGYSLNYSIFDIENYFVTPFMLLYVFMAIGLATLVGNFKKYIPFALLLPIINFSVNISQNNRSSDVAVEEYSKNLLKNIDTNAIVISSQWDYFVGPFTYLQKVEKIRPDIIIFEKELLRRTWYPLQFKLEYPKIYDKSKQEFIAYEQILELFESNLPYNPNEIQAKYLNLHRSIIDQNIYERPIYVTLESYLSEPDFFNQYDIVPFGFAMKILPRGSSIENLDKVQLDLTKIARIKNKYNGILDKGIIEIIQAQLKNMIIYANRTNQLNVAQKLQNELQKMESIPK